MCRSCTHRRLFRFLHSTTLTTAMSKAPLPTYLRTYRKRSCLSQREIAVLIATLSGTTVSRHEEGSRSPSLADALAYEALFGVPASALFPREYEKARAGVEARALGLLGKLTREGKDAPRHRHKRLFLETVLRRVRS